jgi:uncharacterized BrkB/YihY/UPF0761 family membrane protein
MKLENIVEEKETKNEFFSKVKFQYKRISLFLMGWTILVLFVGDPIFRKDLFYYTFEIPAFGFTTLEIIGVVSFFIFTFRETLLTKQERDGLIFFAILINFINALAAQVHIIQNQKGILVIFPILNIVYAYFYLDLYVKKLSFLFKTKKITPEEIFKERPKNWELILGAIFVTILFLISKFLFKTYWAITFSICTTYANFLHDAVVKVFSKYSQKFAKFFRSVRFF